MTPIDEQLQQARSELMQLRSKFNAAQVKYRWHLIGAAAVIALLLVWVVFRKPKPLPPIVKTTIEFKYLENDATAAIRKADSLQRVADYWRNNAIATQQVSNFYKSQIHEADNFLTDIRNGMYGDSIATRTTANFLHRYLGYTEP